MANPLFSFRLMPEAAAEIEARRLPTETPSETARRLLLEYLKLAPPDTTVATLADLKNLEARLIKRYFQAGNRTVSAFSETAETFVSAGSNETATTTETDSTFRKNIDRETKEAGKVSGNDTSGTDETRASIVVRGEPGEPKKAQEEDRTSGTNETPTVPLATTGTSPTIGRDVGFLDAASDNIRNVTTGTNETLDEKTELTAAMLQNRGVIPGEQGSEKEAAAPSETTETSDTNAPEGASEAMSSFSLTLSQIAGTSGTDETAEGESKLTTTSVVKEGVSPEPIEKKTGGEPVGQPLPMEPESTTPERLAPYAIANQENPQPIADNGETTVFPTSSRPLSTANSPQGGGGVTEIVSVEQGFPDLMVQPEALVQQPTGEGQGLAVPTQTTTTPPPPPFNSEVQLVAPGGESSPQTSELEMSEQSIELESNDEAVHIAVTTTSEDAIAEVAEEPLNLDPAEVSSLSSEISDEAPTVVSSTPPGSEAQAIQQELLSTSDTVSSIVKPLEPKYLTSKQLAKLLRVTPRTINFEAKKGNKNFCKWSTKQGQGTYDFEVMNPGEPRLARKFFKLPG